MTGPVIELLRANYGLFLDRLVGRIAATIPRYALVDAAELRRNIDVFFEDLVHVIEDHDRREINDRLITDAQRRFGQGFSPSDYLRAILLVFPVIREVVREKGPKTEDVSFQKGVAAFEAALHELASTSAAVYVNTVSRQLEAKNQELNSLNQQLRAHERVLSLEAEQAAKALRSANQFNQRVIESLTSGVMVVESKTQKVLLYSSRMEEILTLPAELVLGRPVLEALAPLPELDIAAMVEIVRAMGRLPLTKLRTRLPNGRHRSVYLQAQRLYDADGNAEGTVVVVDDVTERELLIDSFSRYVSRDLLQRLLSRAEPLGLESEQKVCTILFADIRGFTRLAENLDPHLLHELLNAYFRLTIDAIVARGGFIDKFVGDKVMAIFSADPAEGAIASVLASQDITHGLKALNIDRRTGGLANIEVGIGLNTGEVLLGNVGSEERMDFTAIGDTVNIADRLQSLARGGAVVMGEETARLTNGRFPLTDRGPCTVKGRGGAVQVFELVMKA